MSTGESTLTAGAGGDNEEELDGTLAPQLVQEIDDGDSHIRRELEPLVVTRLGGTLPWDTDSTQLQCGETVTSNNGDLNIRLVYEAVMTHNQFQILQQMRSNPASVRLVSRSYTGPVTFDELKFDRIPDANGAVVRGLGSTTQPLYEVQLQSKENEGG